MRANVQIIEPLSPPCYLHALAIAGTTHMPQSLVLNLTTQSAIPRQHLQGYALQQLFFSLIESVDPELSHILRRDKQNRSYSLSAIQIESLDNESLTDGSASLQAIASDQSSALGNLHLLSPKAYASELQYTHHQAIAANTLCWWRITFLDDALFDHLFFLWNQLRDEVFPLGASSVVIGAVTAELPGLGWSSSCSYRDIYEHASTRTRDIHLEFITPATFEKEGFITPLPTTEALFHPLRRRWNRYSGLVFAPSLISGIVPSSFNIQTESVQNAERHSVRTLVGCTGQISFRIAGDRDPLIIKRINTLADFTRYCGVGRNTRFGMGVIRRVTQAQLARYQPPTHHCCIETR